MLDFIVDNLHWIIILLFTISLAAGMLLGKAINMMYDGDGEGDSDE